MKQQTERRVVVSGLGAVTANGIGKEAFWQATSKGISGIKPLPNASEQAIQVAGVVSDFLVSDYIDRKLANRTDRMTHLVFAAVQEAFHDARLKLDEEDPRRVGAVIANTAGGIEYVIEQIKVMHARGPRYLSAYTAIAWLQVANVGQISIRHGIQGYCKTPVNDTIGGLDALGTAFHAIRHGAADVIVTGGTEALLHPFVLLMLAHSGHAALGDDPRAYRPFDRRAAGLLMAEGAGICILEEYEHALRRGAPIYGEIVGYGQTNDAHGMLAPSANGKQYARALSLAMQEGAVRPHELGYISLDGRAMPESDQGEVAALHSIFGSDLEHIPVSVPRTTIGHAYAAAGALDAITALLALRDNLIPPTINCEEIDPRYDLDLVHREARPMQGSVVLLGGRSIGGPNVGLALRKMEE